MVAWLQCHWRKDRSAQWPYVQLDQWRYNGLTFRCNSGATVALRSAVGVALPLTAQWPYVHLQQWRYSGLTFRFKQWP